MRNLFLSLLLFIPCLAIAQEPVDRLVLKDGSVHDGYIKVQPLDKEYFIFESYQTTAIVTGATAIPKQKLDIDKLPEHWKKWAKENRDLIRKDEDGLILSDIIFNKAKSENLQDVYVLEDGDEIKFIDRIKRIDTIPFAKIKYVERILEPDNIINKTIDVIKKKNDNGEETIKGQIISQELGEKVRIKQETGGIKVIKISDIISEKKEKGFSDLSFCEQSQYWERVKTNQNGQEYEGVITMRYYGNDIDDSYLEVTDKDDQSHKVRMKDVTEIQKYPNNEYKKKILYNVEDDHVYVNDTLTQWYQAKVSTTFSSKKIEVRGDSCIVKIKIPENSFETSVEIAMKNTKGNKESLLFKSIKKVKDYRFSFSYETIVTNKIDSQSSIVCGKEDELLCRSYILQKGVYILYRESDRKCILFEIE
ncbi:MAG: hypothetical protein J5616_03540 [Bacteroidaceae bacterium]|nr:hypothetical protein [Bacteroidaceae bacterium]